MKFTNGLTKGRLLSWVLLLLLPAFTGAVEFSAIEKNIETTMKTFDVPGVAVAIVKDDKLVFAKGFGVKKMGGNQKVDAKTLFGIASNTKAFTAAAIAILVDEGKLNWDDKIIEHLPNFRLYDPYATAEFTVADMLSHRSGLGLGGGDLMIWPTTDISNEEIMARMRYIKPASSFRSKYAYNNIMYVVAGELVAKVSGMSWQDFVSQRILQPLEMKDTRMSYARIEPSNQNVATPHAPVDGVLKPVGGDFLEKFTSAGSMASNVVDISKWLRVQLRKGLIKADNGEEQRLFSDEQHHQMWSAQTVQEVPEFLAQHFKTNFRAYGLGWGLNDHHGRKMVGHTGGIMGMISKVVMVPEENLGLVILTNQQSGSAFNAIAYDIVNRFLAIDNPDWVKIFDDKLQTSRKENAQTMADMEAARNKDSKPSLPLKAYAQTYNDPWYGDVEVALVKGKLQMRFTRTKVLIGQLEHYQYNTFIVRWFERSTHADALVNFHLSAEGEIEQVTMKAAAPDVDFSFDFHDLLLKPVGVEVE